MTGLSALVMFISCVEVRAWPGGIRGWGREQEKGWCRGAEEVGRWDGGMERKDKFQKF